LQSSEGGIDSSPRFALFAVSFSNHSGESIMPSLIYSFVWHPFMPEVAFTEFPPQNPFFSRSNTLPPFYITEWAAE